MTRGSWRRRGLAAAWPERPAGELASGNVYVVDQGNLRVQKLDSDGNFVTEWGTYGSEDGQLYYPEGVTTNTSGDVYVADTYNNRIQKSDSSGNFISGSL